jgi:hypothetical protein
LYNGTVRSQRTGLCVIEAMYFARTGVHRCFTAAGEEMGLSEFDLSMVVNAADSPFGSRLRGPLLEACGLRELDRLSTTIVPAAKPIYVQYVHAVPIDIVKMKAYMDSAYAEWMTTPPPVPVKTDLAPSVREEERELVPA